MLVTQKAPDFTAPAVLENNQIIQNFNFKNYIHNKKAVVFFWPMDFTFVCPSELIAFNKRYSEFKKRNTEIVGISLDSEFVHQAWRLTPIDQGGIGTIQYPMISDIKRSIIQSYNIEHPDIGCALRASFIIDTIGIVRHESINDLPFGRNIDEIIRLIDALDFYENHGHVCPAQWKQNQEGISPNKEGISQFLSKNFKNL